MGSDKHIKKELVERSEELVDLIEGFEQGIRDNDEEACRDISHKLDQIGFYLVDLIPKLSGDDYAYAQFMMGSLCSVLRMWPQADEAYREALDHWPDHVGLLNEYFICLMELERYDDALSVIEQSIKHGGETPDVLQNKAAALARLGKISEAKVVLINSSARFPNDTETREMLVELDHMTV